MQASLPEGVETVVKALTREKTSLELAIRRIRKKLEIAPAEKVREAQAHLMKDKCGKCDPCMIKNGDLYGGGGGVYCCHCFVFRVSTNKIKR